MGWWEGYSGVFISLPIPISLPARCLIKLGTAKTTLLELDVWLSHRARSSPSSHGECEGFIQHSDAVKNRSVVNWFSPPWFLARDFIPPSGLALKLSGCCETQAPCQPAAAGRLGEQRPADVK